MERTQVEQLQIERMKQRQINEQLSKERMGKFEDITEVSDVISYLDAANQRLASIKYLHHYTTLESAIKIIQSQKWHLASAENMNDMKEYENGDEKRWKNLFFSSFMREDKESIGMWSMYAQPWKEGVKISIPRETFKRWIVNVNCIYEISTKKYGQTKEGIPLKELHNGEVYISTVAYSDSESREDRKESRELLQCGGKKNKHFKDAVKIPELTGYVKDMAWSYEKEVRIKAKFDNSEYGFKRVSIDIPDYVIEDMIITASPLFEGDLRTRLKERISREIQKTGKSLFDGKLIIKDPCDECKFRRAAQEMADYALRTLD